MLNKELEFRIRAASIEQYARNKEACGLIVKGEFVQVPNTAEVPSENFRIEPQHLIVEGIEAVWHSHISGHETLSPADIASCLHHQLPFILYIVKTDKFKVFNPLPNNDYLDREPCPEINDCWSIVDHWYRFELGIKLKSFDRSAILTRQWGSTDADGNNVFAINAASAGFEKISLEQELKVGDVLGFQIGADSIDHVGVLTNPDEFYFLHQLKNQPSKIDRLTGSWRDCLMAVGRHKSTK